MLHKTKGLVLRSVKYGETSLVVTIFTELFGVQSYLINGVRNQSAKKPSRANYFQPAAMLDLVVYHHDQKNLQRIREFKWSYLYTRIFREVKKNAVALFMVEVLQKCLKQPEPNPELFQFLEDSFIHLDVADEKVTANFPLFFILHLAHFFGFRIRDDYNKNNIYLDLQEGGFFASVPDHMNYLKDPFSFQTSQLLKTMQPQELAGLSMHRETRRILLEAYLNFYAFHQPGFGKLKSLPVLQEVLGD